jgi:Rrf2 family protein
MKFSAQEEYGLRCLIALSRKGVGNSMTIPELSEQEGLTSSHVAKILSILRRHGFVTSTRGQLGGYQLSMEPRDMVLRDVLEPLGGRMFGEEFCDRHTGILSNCVHETDCTLRPLWNGIQQAVDGIVGRFTVQDLLDGTVEGPTIQVGHGRRASLAVEEEVSC